MLDLKKLAESKSNPKKDWLTVLESSRQTLSLQVLDDKRFELLANASSTPEQFTLISKLLYQTSKSHPRQEIAIEELLKNVDDSKFSLAEWLESIEAFYSWLSNQERKTNFLTVLGYLQCCGQSPENKDIRQNFKELLLEMLETHGYNG